MATSLPLATAAAVATILAAAPAGAQPAVPTTPAQPGTNEVQAPEAQPGAPTPQQQAPQQQPSPNQPGVTTPQPGVTTPSDPNAPQPEQRAPGQQASPSQPGITSPRVAPLPVPGQENKNAPQPAVVPEQPAPDNGEADQLKPEQPQPDQSQVTPRPVRPMQPEQGGQGNMDTLTDNAPSQEKVEPQWSAPRLQNAPAAPVVPMQGPHSEVGANIDGGGLVPGYVANTHHFNNADGYVGTVGYSTPTGTGDAGASVEYIEANKIKITTYTHTTGIDDLKSATGFNDITNETYVDTTQANAAKAAVEGWIKMQPGGEAALDAAAQVGKLPEGEWTPQTASVAGVTTQWSGSVQN